MMGVGRWCARGVLAGVGWLGVGRWFVVGVGRGEKGLAGGFASGMRGIDMSSRR